MAQDHSADAVAVAVAAAECQHLAATSPPPNPKTTWEGCSVLLDINDGDRLVFARLSPAATLKIGNKKCSLGPLLGCPFGSLFRVVNGPGGPCLSRCSHSTSGASDNALQAIEEESIAEDSRDNRLLIDNNTAQNLSSDDIDAMRRNGATGDEIVEALISNSATFEKKTVYSQEKYKRKKQKKYAPKVLLRKPSARSICETYFKKFPARIGFLRVDTLSLLLSMANVGAHSDVLLVDMIGGMATGAVAERLGGTGYICSTYFGVTPYPSDIIRMFNFNSEVYSRIVHVPVSDLSKSLDDFVLSEINAKEPSKSLDDFVLSEINAKEPSMLPESSECRNSVDISEVPIQNFDLIKEKSLNHEQTSVMSDVGESQHVASSLCPSGTNDLELGHDTPISDKLVNKGRQAPLETMKQWKTNGFSGLIVAAPESEVGTIVHKLLPLLAYSAPFAIYHQYLQPLAACMHYLQTSKLAISLQISEPWLREYQVLPLRTHPQMQMSSFGGYILSGIRIRNSVPGSI